MPKLRLPSAAAVRLPPWANVVRLWLGVVLVLLVLPLGNAQGQVLPAQGADLSDDLILTEADNQALAQLERFRAQLAEERWDEALSTLRELMQRDGDKLLSVASEPAGFTRYLPLGDHCQTLLLGLPAARRELLPLYREQVDATAAALLAVGRAERDPAKLKQLIQQQFASSHTPEALALLGDLALERGDAVTAARAWRMLDPRLSWQGEESPVAGLPLWLVLRNMPREEWPALLEIQTKEEAANALALVQPAGTMPLEDLLARQVLTSALAGSHEQAEIELAALLTYAPQASGRMGGREGPYAAVLEPLVAAAEPRPATPGQEWHTLGGNAARTARVAEAFDPQLQVVWSRPLPAAGQGAQERLEQLYAFPETRAGERYSGLLSYHPLVVDGQVFVCDSERVYGFDLTSGAPLWGAGAEGVIYRSRYEHLPYDGPITPGLGAPRHTLTSDGKALVARMGSPRTSLPAGMRDFEEPSYLVGLDLASEGRLLQGYPLRLDEESLSFEGTPILAGERMYVALRGGGMRPEQRVACYELTSGRKLWETRVVAAESFGRGHHGEVTHNLLTLAGDTLLANTSLGAVAAIDADSGRLRWLVSYPRDGTRRTAPEHEPWHVQRDLAPCLVHDGLVIVAPADCEQIFALDLVSGQLIWSTNLPAGSLDITYLMGVAGDKLIAAGRRLWWIDVYSGALSGEPPANPFPQSTRPDVTGFGRGILAGGAVYWPARGEIDEIYVFDAANGQPLRQPIPLTPCGATAGNLVWANGMLLIAGSEALYALAAPPAELPGPQARSEEGDSP